MKDIHRWYADKCGVKVGNNPYDSLDADLYYRASDDKQAAGRVWDIADARCREIVRENLRITTMVIGDDSYVSFQMPFDLIGLAKNLFFKTIAESELACLEAIYGARDE